MRVFPPLRGGQEGGIGLVPVAAVAPLLVDDGFLYRLGAVPARARLVEAAVEESMTTESPKEQN
jgi:hypothetical protein